VALEHFKEFGPKGVDDRPQRALRQGVGLDCRLEARLGSSPAAETKTGEKNQGMAKAWNSRKPLGNMERWRESHRANSQEKESVKKRYWLGMGIVAVGLAGWLAFDYYCIDHTPRELPDPKAIAPVNDDSGQVSVCLERCLLGRIPPGTVIEDSPPLGWTNIVRLIEPVLTEKDLQNTPELVAFYAQLFKDVTLAKVEKVGRNYELKLLAVGPTAKVKGKDTVIDVNHRYGADLGMFGGRFLAAYENGFRDHMWQLVQTPTLRVFDERQLFLRGGKHTPMLVRNAVRVDRKSGQLTTLVWLLTDNKDEENILAEENMQLLPDGYREKYNPSIRYNQFVLGLPTSDDVFARREITQGKPVQFTPALRRLAARKSYTREEALELEEALRAAASAAGKP
jgi:hypothetical protein